MKINWKIRITNPTFWASVAVSFFLPIFAHAGYNWQQVTSWPMLFGLVGDALSSPAMVVAIGISIFNCIYDPTTRGVSDSPYALTKSSANDTPIMEVNNDRK